MISASKLDKEGFTTTFGESSWNLSKVSMVISLKATLVYTLYFLVDSSICTMKFFSIVEDAKIWHWRLGHMSEKGMKVLYSKKLLLKLEEVDLGFCEDCIYNKHKRERFLKVGKEKKIKKLELVHTDVWGSTQVTSL